MDAEAVVREFWRLMGTNDFHAVTCVLAPGFVLEWPQSRERVRGGAAFARMNAEYPSQGPWRFEIRRLVATEASVVTLVHVTDGTTSADAVSFFDVVDDRITRLVEYWPERYPAPAHRAHLVEAMGADERGG